MAKDTKTIVIIEDNKIDQLIAQKIIESVLPSVTINFFQRADWALKLIQSEKFHASAILLDLDLPLFDGFEFLTELSEIKFKVPIYILTALLEDKIDRGKMSHYPVKGIFTKPLQKEDVLKMAREFEF